ncbi:MAG: PEGA domain-containing protein [Deltaproteobacteria bacterium]|nr:PEGA domain-containing protein [Deltaproteobacteria bacterium]
MGRPTIAVRGFLLVLAALLAGAGEAAGQGYSPQVLEAAEQSFRHATLALEAKQHRTAEKAFRRVMALVPEMPGSYWGLGIVAFTLGDCAQAVTLLELYLEKLEALNRSGSISNPRPPKQDALDALERCRTRAAPPPPPELGQLQVGSTPPGALISLAGKEHGVTPLTLPQLPPGRHRLRLILDGHSPVEQEVVLAPGEQKIIHLTLVRTARLDLISRPSGADVRLDGQPLGRTPLSLPLLGAGAHRLELSLPGLPRPWVGGVVLDPQRTVTLTIPLAADGGLLTVTSDPPGAEVTLDEAAIGHTPLGPVLVAEGEHLLSVVLQGHALEQQSIHLRRGQPVDLQLQLRPIRLDLRAVGLPAGAAFYVDGEPVAVEDGWLRGIPAGEHELMAVKDGYRPWFARAVLEAGSSDEIEVRMARQPRGRGLFWWSLGSGAVAVGAFCGAALLGHTALQHGGTADYVLAGGLAALGVGAAVVALQSWSVASEPASAPLTPGGERSPTDLQARLDAAWAKPGWRLALGGRF